MSSPFLDQLYEIQNALADRGVQSTIEYPGYVAIPSGANHSWAFGVANGDVWTGDLTANDGGEPIESVRTSIEVSIPADADTIAAAILAAIAIGGNS